LGDKNYVIYGETTFKTHFEFIKASGFFTDLEKSEAAFFILKEKIKLHESPPLTPDDLFDDDY